MTARRVAVWLWVVLGAVVGVVVADSSGVVSDDVVVVVDNLAQLAAGLTATVLCWWTARRVHGPERSWRRLMALGMAGWTVGQAFWSWYQVVSDRPLPSPSWADVGYLTLPVLALPALVMLAAVEPPRALAASLRRASAVFVLDGLVVVGALFVLTWSTALGAVVHAGAPTTLAFVVAIAYPVTDLILVVIVVLLAATGRVGPQLRVQLRLLGLGLVALSVSDSIFAYLVASGADEMPPATNAGFVAGPLLIGLAALATSPRPTDAAPAGTGAAMLVRRVQVVERAHLLLPYAFAALTGAVIVVQKVTGERIDAVEASVGWTVLALVLMRQVVTLFQNTVQLERVSATQAELTYRAQHDPLTGLANRVLFGERLLGAMAGHRDEGRRYALLLVDLDDFKAVNDSLGHAAGDALLHAVAQRLRHCVRSTDTVARIGGDEFAVVLDGATEEPGIVGQRIVAALQAPFAVELAYSIRGDGGIDGAGGADDGSQIVSLGASVGVVEPSQEEVDLTPEVLLRRADGAMYLGKRGGKGRAVHYEPGAAGTRLRDQAEDRRRGA